MHEQSVIKEIDKKINAFATKKSSKDPRTEQYTKIYCLFNFS
jgi:hypothetical protein